MLHAVHHLGNTTGMAGLRANLIAGTFFHLSNDGRAGKDHNPDLEMMGGYLGWPFCF